MKFKKMHGLGNDFVIFDARNENLYLTPDDMSLIADRRWGVGCDLITIIDASEKADVFAYFFNADGSESAACGNASRCVADLVMATFTITGGNDLLKQHPSTGLRQRNGFTDQSRPRFVKQPRQRLLNRHQ